MHDVKLKEEKRNSGDLKQKGQRDYLTLSFYQYAVSIVSGSQILCGF